MRMLRRELGEGNVSIETTQMIDRKIGMLGITRTADSMSFNLLR